MKTVYVFRGAPASGKSTIVPSFCQFLPKPVSLISHDNLRWGFHLIGRKVSDVSDEEHMFAYKNMLLIFEQYLKNGHYTIVIEGLFTWDDPVSSQGNIKGLCEIAKNYGYDLKSIVLIAEKSELLSRNETRSYSVPKDEFERLYKNIYKTIGSGEKVFDSTGQSLDHTVFLIKGIVSQSNSK